MMNKNVALNSVGNYKGALSSLKVHKTLKDLIVKNSKDLNKLTFENYLDGTAAEYLNRFLSDLVYETDGPKSWFELKQRSFTSNQLDKYGGRFVSEVMCSLMHFSDFDREKYDESYRAEGESYKEAVDIALKDIFSFLNDAFGSKFVFSQLLRNVGSENGLNNPYIDKLLFCFFQYNDISDDFFKQDYEHSLFEKRIGFDFDSSIEGKFTNAFNKIVNTNRFEKFIDKDWKTEISNRNCHFRSVKKLVDAYFSYLSSYEEVGNPYSKLAGKEFYENSDGKTKVLLDVGYLLVEDTYLIGTLEEKNSIEKFGLIKTVFGNEAVAAVNAYLKIK